MPPESRIKLHREYRLQAIVNVHLWRQLQEIGEALDRSGIRVVLLKGAYLAYWVYEDPGLRRLSDLDLLCRPDDWDSVKQVLEGIGYRQQYETSAIDCLSAHPLPFFRRQGARIDVHLDLRCGLNTEDVISRAVPAEREGVRFLTLALPDSVRYLIAHLTRHARNSGLTLIWFVDIHEIVSQSQEAFERIASELWRDIVRDSFAASVYAFLTCYWLGSVGNSALARPFEQTEILRQLAGRSSSFQVTNYLWALKRTRHLIGGRAKARYLKSLFLPSLRVLAARDHAKRGLGLYLYYVARFFLIPTRAIRSILRNRTSQ